MLRILVAGFLISHGFVHAAIYGAPRNQNRPAPFDPHQSWLLVRTHSRRRPIHVAAAALGWAVAAVYSLAALGLLAGVALWPDAVAVAAIIALVLKLVWFNFWLIVGLAIDVGVIVAVSAGWPESLLG